MYAHVLVPLSLDDDRSLRPALTLAQRLVAPEGKITLMHVLDEVPRYASNYLPFGYQDDTRAQIEEALKAAGADMGNVEGMVVQGAPVKAILECTSQRGVDCLVLTGPKPGDKERLLHDTIGQLVRQAGCAIHILRE